MILEEIELPIQNKVMQSYINDKEFLHTYFDYENEQDSFPKRLEELKKRSFNHQGVSRAIHSFMQPFGLSARARMHIEELQNGAVTVIGGQQAGVLTGPLYSVHKAITVILLAKKQRKLLQVPVVPVFWVAGEDHDLNEINHVYTNAGKRVIKEQIKDKFALKLMASDAVFDQNEMKEFIVTIFSKFGETSYTKELLTDVLQAVEKEQTFTGFFVRLMNGLFADEGLLFIDSAYKPFRQLESDYFSALIKNSVGIAASIVEQEQQFEHDGFGKPVNAQIDAAHLFYVHTTGRVLLSRRGDVFFNDSAGLRFTESELLAIAKNDPSLLSNNVMTRPLMQDLVFPVLAFVGGPGEIAYWALLKDAFHQLNLKMPIITPRMSLTLVTRRTSKILQEKSFTIEDVITGEVAAQRVEFINGLYDNQFDEAVDEMEEKLKLEYEKISISLGEEEQMMHELLQKNLTFHASQFNYLKEKAYEALLIKHEVELMKFSDVETALFPNGGLQERVFTPYTYLNSYGPTLVHDLLQIPFEIDERHKVIYL